MITVIENNGSMTVDEGTLFRLDDKLQTEFSKLEVVLLQKDNVDKAIKKAQTAGYSAHKKEFTNYTIVYIYP